MQLQTILNKVQKFKGYVYENVTLSQDGKKLDVHIRPRRGSCPTCSDCGRKGNAVKDFESGKNWGSTNLRNMK